MALVDGLVRPFITIEFDEETRWDIPAGPADYDRIATGLGWWLDRGREGGDLEYVRASLGFLCGEPLGGEVYGKLHDYLTGGADFDEEALAQYMMPAVLAIADAWAVQVRAVKSMRARRFAHYLGGPEDAI